MVMNITVNEELVSAETFSEDGKLLDQSPSEGAAGHEFHMEHRTELEAPFSSRENYTGSQKEDLRCGQAARASDPDWLFNRGLHRQVKVWPTHRESFPPSLLPRPEP